MSEYSKKLYISKGGNIEAIPLYTDLNEVGTPALRLKDGNNNIFAKLGGYERGVSSLHCLSGGTDYSAMKGKKFAYELLALFHFDDATKPIREEVSSYPTVTWIWNRVSTTDYPVEWTGSNVALNSNAKFGKSFSGKLVGRLLVDVPQMQVPYTYNATPLDMYDSNLSYGMFIYIPSIDSLRTLLPSNGKEMTLFEFKGRGGSYGDQFSHITIYRNGYSDFRLRVITTKPDSGISDSRQLTNVNVGFETAGWHHLVIQHGNNAGGSSYYAAYPTIFFGLDGVVYRTYYIFIYALYYAEDTFTVNALNGILIDELFIMCTGWKNGKSYGMYTKDHGLMAGTGYTGSDKDVYEVPTAPLV